MKLRIFLKYNLTVIFIFLFILLSTGCAKEEIKIGFAGSLTGRSSALGVSARNGVLLAVEELNEKGGIKGTKVKLIIKDDRNDTYIAKNEINELIENNVSAIIGNVTSEMSAAVLPFINKEEVLMISPTTSSCKLSYLDDFFLRVSPANNEEQDMIANYAYKDMNLKNISVIYDLSNRTYTKEFYEGFKIKYEKIGGSIAKNIGFISGSNISYKLLSEELIDLKPDGVFIIANTIDTALLCQQLKKINPEIPIIASFWAMTEEILEYGSKSVEGVIFSQVVDKNCDKKTYEIFKEKYYNRFNKEPNYGAVLGYETAQVLFEGIKLSSDLNSEDIKKAILKKEKFNGLQGEFEINKYGDAVRECYLFVVENGKFKRLK